MYHIHKSQLSPSVLMPQLKLRRAALRKALLSPHLTEAQQKSLREELAKIQVQLQQLGGQIV
jgi:hypothetical protein